MAISFDRVSDIYDATRGFPPQVSEQVTDAILRLSAATPDSQFFEPGIGTGRIALPIVQRGYSYTGVDISLKMMDELRRKLGDTPHRLSLVQGDATALPFAEHRFDVALTVHLLHLIPAWRQALAEIRRVLKPGGLYLFCYDNGGPSSRRDFDQQWQAILERYGHRQVKYGATNQEVIAQLQQQGAQLETVIASRWQKQRTVGELLGLYTGRAHSASWQIPEPIFAAAIEELRVWSQATYGSESLTLNADLSFRLVAARYWA